MRFTTHYHLSSTVTNSPPPSRSFLRLFSHRDDPDATAPRRPTPLTSAVRVSSEGRDSKRMSLRKRKTMSSPSPLKLGLSGKKIRFSPPKLDTEIIISLPDELIRDEILARLPIKAMVRFKSVCKSWLSIFSDPQFVKQHNNLQNPCDSDCLVAHKSRYIGILSRYQETFVLPNKFYRLIGSAKGLVCIQCDNILSLWNPAIHQSKEFHLPPLGYGCLDRVGFGYDPVRNDYRVGICYRSVDKSRLCYAVYSSNSDSWIHHHFDDPDYESRISKFKDSRTPTTMVKDSPYWTTCSTTVDKDKLILSLAALKFDPTSNKFKLLPDFSSYFSKEKTFKVLNMRDLLSFVTYEPCPVRTLDVYSLDEDKGCGGVWSKMYRFGPFEHIWRFKHLQQGFKYGDEIVFEEFGEIYRFDHKTDTFECIPGMESASLTDCFTYTPSLVSLQGMTSIYLQNQTPPLGHHSTSPPLRLVDSLKVHWY